MTQEALAEYLGVSAPAVNKWEKGNAYPDITLLPALAKVLDTDLNTLLSFDNDLTDLEVGSFIGELNAILENEGFDNAFKAAIEKIRKYPSNDKLIFMIGSFLLSALSMANEEKKDDYSNMIEKYLNKIIKSNDPAIKVHAKSIMIGKYLDSKDYEKAEKIINSMPETTLSKEFFQAELHIAKDEYEKAYEKLEGKILINATEILAFLLRMIQITKDEDKRDDAGKYSKVYDEVGSLFDLNYNLISQGQLEIAILDRDVDACIELLENMVNSDRTPWSMNNSVLYKHMNQNVVAGNTSIYQRAIIDGIIKREDTEFLKGDQRFVELSHKFH